MNWETLLGFAGLYIMMLVLLVHHFRTSFKLSNLDTKILKMANNNQKILQVVKGMVAEDIEKREGDSE